MKIHKKGFTLVELIVVITILAILGSIAFVSLQGYGKSARDSARISEVGQFKAGLEIFAAQSGYYMPAGNAELLDDTNTGALSFVGTTGEDLARITNLSEAISDPVTGVEYTYAVAGNKKQYEVYYELEAEDAGIINSASAFDATKKVVTGNYNGVFTIAEKGQVVAMPSLVTTTGTITLGSDSVDFKMSEKDTDVTFTPVKVADTVPTKIAAQKTMVEAIQTAYSGNESLSENIKEVTSLDTTKTSEIESFVIGGLGSDKVDNTVEQDTTAPEGGSFTIDEGSQTNSSTVNLSITCPSETGVEMLISGDIVESLTWEPCASSKSVTLKETSSSDKIISMEFRDSLENTTESISQTINFFIHGISYNDNTGWNINNTDCSSCVNGRTKVLGSMNLQSCEIEAAKHKATMFYADSFQHPSNGTDSWRRRIDNMYGVRSPNHSTHYSETASNSKSCSLYKWDGNDTTTSSGYNPPVITDFDNYFAEGELNGYSYRIYRSAPTNNSYVCSTWLRKNGLQLYWRGVQDTLTNLTNNSSNPGMGSLCTHGQCGDSRSYLSSYAGNATSHPGYSAAHWQDGYCYGYTIWGKTK